MHFRLGLQVRKQELGGFPGVDESWQGGVSLYFLPPFGPEILSASVARGRNGTRWEMSLLSLVLGSNTIENRGQMDTAAHMGVHLEAREGLHRWWRGQGFILKQWFSTFLMLQSCNSNPHAVVTHNHSVVLLFLHTCNFATVRNCNINS